jgi:high-affinity iron transporter
VLVTVLIVWRESLEAALVIGILLTFLARNRQPGAIRSVWIGCGVGVLAAALCAAVPGRALARLPPDLQQLVHAELMFIAALLLFWTVLWMHLWARAIRRGAPPRTFTRTRFAAIAFVTVFREGVEAALFLSGTVSRRPDAGTLGLMAAGIAGTGLAVGTAWLFFRGFDHLPLRTYLELAGVLLVVVAGGLLVLALDDVIALDYLPPAWNIAWSPGGESSYDPALEYLVFLSYVPAMLWATWRRRRAASVRIVRRPRGRAS